MPFLPDFFLCSPYYILGVTRIFWKNQRNERLARPALQLWDAVQPA